jgi:Zn ribbon nucleic-acid-binding protein
MLPSDAPCLDYVARKKRFIASNCPRCGSRRLSIKLENIRECHTCSYVFNPGMRIIHEKRFRRGKA